MLVFTAIVKNEAPYLLEWIAYHRAVGVDHFIIFDNESTDGTFFLLRPLARAGIITYVRWVTRAQYVGFKGHDIGPQVPAYDFAVRICRKLDRWKWIGFIDLDEFVVTTSYPTIQDVLREYDAFGALGLSWRMFGSSGHVSAPVGTVIENYTRRASDDFPANRHVKTIAQIACIQRPGIHIPSILHGDIVDTKERPICKAHDGIHDEAVYDIMYINHYFTKSAEEWKRKRLRGRATKSLSDAERLRSDSMFVDYDRNDVLDGAILRFLPVVKERLSELSSIIRESLGSELTLDG